MSSPISLAPPVNSTIPVAGPSQEYLAWKVDGEHKNRTRTINLQVLFCVCLVLLACYHALKRVSLTLTARWGPQENVRGGGHAYVRALRATRAFVRKYLLYVTVPTPFFIYTLPEMLLVFLYGLTLYIVVLGDVSRSPLFTPANIYIQGTGNRSAMAFVATLPWLVAFAMKNNPISSLTGIPYERLQIFHRACSRISLSLVLLHAATKLKASTSMVLDWRKWGVVAFACASGLFVTSHRNGFNWFYQAFVHLHVPLVAGLFVCIWQHTVNAPLKDIIQPLVLVSAGLWGLDMLTRLAQLVWINALYRPKAACVTTMRMTILSREMLRVEMIKPGMQDWIPGSHVYLFSPPFFGVSPFWQSHPFTIASIARHEGQSRHKKLGVGVGDGEKRYGFASHQTENGSMELRSLRHDEAAEDPFAAPATSSSPTYVAPLEPNSSRSSGDEGDCQSKLVFLIKKRAGFTKKLYELAQRKQSTRLLIYGPLSPPLSYLSSYETLVFFSGGSGVSWALPLLLEACRNTRKNFRFTRQIFWIWSVAYSEQMHWISSELSQALSTDIAQVTVDVRIHVTQELAHIRDPPRAWEEVVPRSDKSSNRQRAPWLIQGRPHVHGLLSSAVESAGGRIWVGVCGPSSLKLAVRSAVRDWIQPTAVWKGDAKGDIALHAENFGW